MGDGGGQEQRMRAEEYLREPGAGLAGNPGGEAEVPDNGGQPLPHLLHQNVLGGQVPVEEA